jgi:hypothetical protein
MSYFGRDFDRGLCFLVYGGLVALALLPLLVFVICWLVWRS